MMDLFIEDTFKSDINLKKVNNDILKEMRGKFLYTEHPSDAIKHRGIVKAEYKVASIFLNVVMVIVLFSIFNVSTYNIVQIFSLIAVIILSIKNLGIDTISKSKTYPYIIRINSIDNSTGKVKMETCSRIANNKFNADIDVLWSPTDEFLKLKIKNIASEVPYEYISDNDLTEYGDGIYLDARGHDIKELVSKYLDKNEKV